MKYLLFITLLFSGGVYAACESIKNNLTMGFVPSRSVHEIQLNSKKIADYLSEITGYKIKAITLTNYAGLAISMKSKRVDLAFVGPLNYLVIKKYVDVEPLTAAVRNGKKGYQGIIIVRKDSDIYELSDLKGKSVIFGDQLSTSASLYPKAALKASGIDPSKDIKSLSMSSQSAIVMSVIKGKADAGAVYDDARTNPEINRYAEDVLEKTRVIYRTELIPADPQIIRSAMCQEQKDAIKSALVTMSHGSETKIWLKQLYGIDELVPAFEDEYRPLIDVVSIERPGLIN